MKYDFCTYFDKNYLIRGLTLYDSLKRQCQDFRLWILCMDRKTYDILNILGFTNVELIHLEDFEYQDEGLKRAKKNRAFVEYYFTCTP